MQARPTVLVVRPRAQADAWVAQLGALGVQARALPLIDIQPAPDAAAVADAFQALARARQPLAVFVSPNAVEGFFGALGETAAWPDGAIAGATGPGTVAALKAAGVPEANIVSPAASAEQFDSEALWHMLRGEAWNGRVAWLVRGNGGREWLGDRLRGAGAEVRTVQSYVRSEPQLGPAERALLASAQAEPDAWVWLFSSSEAIGHLAALAPGAQWRASRALATHVRIEERARAQGFGRVDVVPPLPAAVAQALQA